MTAAVNSFTDSSSVAHVPKPRWYRSTFYNAWILGIVNFLAPGIWGAMNSLGAGGQASPHLVNAANSLTFCLMVLSCFFSSALVNLIGIKPVLIIGTMGYAPYAAGLYTNNRFGTEWFVLVGAALCGLSAGLFWMSEAAIALAYPEPQNQGKFLGLWLSFRVGGQLIGGAVNLGLNSKNGEAGKVSYTVYIVFIILQSLAPFAGLLLTPPKKVQRTDGRPVRLAIQGTNRRELIETAKLFVTREFLLIIPLIAQAVYSEAVMFTYLSLWFSVRARALGSFLSAIVALTGGNILGWFLDRKQIALKVRARSAFVVILTLQGAWWIWSTILTTRFNRTKPTFDWGDDGFPSAFTLFLLLVLSFQLQYLYLYFVVGHLARTPAEVVRIAGLLRGTESAAQAVSYGLGSITSFATIGGSAINFGLWGIALVPAWFVVRDIGGRLGDRREERERAVIEEEVKEAASTRRSSVEKVEV
ncbi:MFS general substrate transporter [Polyporus arcularius HHB13444]|uniref:MFS general substrate transporter n=1 Tax=Polyporus arcularius HHB13444 TaxID=1314778 RepID=A0A5C3PXV8_9APHY|nr:MFS general substrate transporter [Polyporus arcularius HHB13444]